MTVFRNRLDSSNPLYARPPRGTLAHTGRAATLSVETPSGGGGNLGNLFNSSWETGTTGCSTASLLDGTVWPGNTLWEDGGGIDCTGHSGQPLTEVTTAQAAPGYGTKSLRVWQAPGNINGTDFRVVKTISQITSGYFFMRWYIRWGSNWHFGSSDHKMLITGQNASDQSMYWNIRASLTTQATGRMTAHHNSVDTVWCDNRPAMALGNNQWHCIETRMQIGANGSLAARVNGVDCVFTLDAGTPRDINNHLVEPVGMFKMDSTYNDGAGVTTFMDQYWDAFAASFSTNANAWIGL